MCAHVVVAEDDADQAELVRLYLEHEGHKVDVVSDGRSALDVTRGTLPDLLILDVMMPRVDGLDVCRVIRADARLTHLPVLLLTARTSEEDMLLGLDLGADDYMVKPFSPRELMARVRSLLRRGERGAASTAPLTSVDNTRGPGPGPGPGSGLRVGGIVVDGARHEAWAHGRPITCTRGEFRLLELLAEHPGQVLSRAQILERLHGADPFITPRTVDVHVMNLRRKIRNADETGDQAIPLVTVYGVGYKLVDGRTAGGRG